MTLPSIITQMPLKDDLSFAPGLGSGSPTFSRASIAQYHRNGKVLTAGVNVPRFNGSALIHEGASTNLILDSNAIAPSANWSPFEGTITGNVDFSPDGAVTAGLLVPNAISGAHYIGQLNSITTGITATVSMYAKPAGHNFLQMFSNAMVGFGTQWVNFNIATGQVLTQNGGAVGSIEAMANGWFRCSMTVTTTGTTVLTSFTVSPTEPSSRGDTFVFTGDNVNGALLWGAQLEEMDHATSLMVTTSSTVSRSTDNLSIDTANWPTLDTDFSMGVTVQVNSPTFIQTVLSLAGPSSAFPLIINGNQFTGSYQGVDSVDTVNDPTSAAFREVFTWSPPTGGNLQALYTDTILRDGDSPTVAAAAAITSVTIGSIGGPLPLFGEISDLRIYSAFLIQSEVDTELDVTDFPTLIKPIEQSIQQPIQQSIAQSIFTEE